MDIITEYKINPQTIAMLPNFHPIYQTKIIEEESIYVTEERIDSILNRNCLDYGASITGRREAIIHKTNYVQKTPILISETLKLIIFPTHSPENMNCAWFMYHQIKRVTPIDKNRCEIVMHNTTKLEAQVSYQALLQQIHKSAVIFSLFCTEQTINFSFEVKGRNKMPTR
ncbi:competence protein ComK [Bacillus sp. FJAT-45066]|uniref:competence protein ComK n=1 Tax=Bacillus sp. FJAT-45066 TaxID=2011010 RepID=UPI000BB6BCF5|nr:competence protein ComK [Bacillus sp. FJAT-45066]